MTNNHAEGPGGPLDSAADAAKLARVKSAVQAMEAVPRQIGPYRILHTLGEGGMGVVYLAEQTQPIHRKVAIKIVKLGMDTKQVIARFETEREALALMNHPHVARVIDAGATETGRPYFVMEYVPGVPMSRYCDEKRLRTEQRLQLFSDVCAAVQHAHQKGIIHRDIKPSNVLVMEIDGKPVVKVIDFGIAKATQQRLSEETYFTATGNIVGTPAYMSPEQAGAAPGGTVADIDTRTDVYSLGVLLYELLVGALPFDPALMRQAAFSEIQRIIREVDPPKPSTRLLALRAAPRASARANVPDSTEPRSNQSPVAVQARARVPVATETQSPANRIADSTTTEVLPSHGEIARAKARGSDLGTIAALRNTPPTTLLKQLRGDLDWIVMKCLEKDRTRRYETVNALVLEINGYLNHEPVLAGPPSATYRLRKFVRRNRAALVAVSFVLVGTTSGMFWALWERGRALEAKQREQSEKELAQSARVDAEQARDEAQAVTLFLNEILGAADPGREGKDVTVREVLDHAVDLVPKRFADKPLIEAALRQTIGWTYHQLGLLPAAEFQAAKGAEIFTRVVGPDDPRTLRAGSNLASIIGARGRYGEGESSLRAALEIQKRLLGEEHPDILITMINLGNSIQAQGRYAEAEELRRKTVDLARRAVGEEAPKTLTAISNLAHSLRSLGRDEEAEQLCRMVLEVQQRTLGEEHPETLRTMTNLQISFWGQGRFGEADEILLKVLEVRRRALGEDHPDTLLSLNNLAASLGTQGRVSEATSLFRRVLEARRRVLGEDHFQTLRTAASLARSLNDQGAHADAEALYRDSLDAQLRKLGREHPDSLLSMRYLGECLQDQQRARESEQLHREEFETRHRIQGEEHPETLKALNALANSLHLQKRDGEAERLHRQVMEVSKRAFGDTDEIVLLATCNLSNDLDGQERYADAEPIHKQCLEGTIRIYGEIGMDTLRSKIYFAANLREQRRFADADELLCSAWKARTEIAGLDWIGRRILEELMQLHTAWEAAEPEKGHAAEAAKWRAKLDELNPGAETQESAEPTRKKKEGSEPAEKKDEQVPAHNP